MCVAERVKNEIAPSCVHRRFIFRPSLTIGRVQCVFCATCRENKNDFQFDRVACQTFVIIHRIQIYNESVLSRLLYRLLMYVTSFFLSRGLAYFNAFLNVDFYRPHDITPYDLCRTSSPINSFLSDSNNNKSRFTYAFLASITASRFGHGWFPGYPIDVHTQRQFLKIKRRPVVIKSIKETNYNYKK